MLTMNERPRRLRSSAALRDLVAQTRLQTDDLIMPIFVQEGHNIITPISTLPGINRYTVDQLAVIADELMALGIKACALFPMISENKKDAKGTEGLNPDNCLCQAIKALKSHAPNLIVITDIALDPYSSDGHDGIVENGVVKNDETVSLLAKMAVLHAAHGADMVAPSDMMDGRVGEIRKQLDIHHYTDTSILAYTAKYASAFYGPFRDALQSAPKSGDKKSYQLSFETKSAALRETRLDESEGADIIMVKPALTYLDIIQDVKHYTTLPVAAYHVSGEYAQLKIAAQHGVLDYEPALLEVLTSIKRAGADIIVTYGAIEAARLLQKNRP